MDFPAGMAYFPVVSIIFLCRMSPIILMNNLLLLVSALFFMGAGTNRLTAEGASLCGMGDNPPDRRNPLVISVLPEQGAYAIGDTVTIVMINPSQDTVFVTPALLSYKALSYKEEESGWSAIIDDLQTYWDEDAIDRGYEYAILQPVPPNGEWHCRVAMSDIAVDFSGELRMRFGVRVLKYYPLGPDSTRARMLDVADSWVGRPFIPPEFSAAEDRLSALRLRGGAIRDTVFTVLDPVDNLPLIPPALFQQHPYRLMISEPLDTMPPDQVHRYRLSWPAPFIDGDLELVISARQIWLRSVHDNPNPNELFWYADISREQFSGVGMMLKLYGNEFGEHEREYGSTRFLEWLKPLPQQPQPDAWSDEMIARHTEDFKESRYRNAQKLVEMINGTLAPGAQIRFPERRELDALRPVRWE